MGIYTRDYFRDGDSGSSWGLDGLTPALKYILLANLIVFLLQIFITREVRITPRESIRQYDPALDKLLTEKEAEGPETVEKLKKEYPELETLLSDKHDKSLEELLHPPTQRVSRVQEWFELDTKKVVFQGQIWRLLTHAFCHDRHGVWHILFNMLCLYWFGGTLEQMYGSREFLLFYLTAAVVAGLAFVGLDLYTGSRIPGIGASGAVMAVMMLYTMHFPRETISICWLIPVEMRWVMTIYVVWELHPILLTLSGDPVFSGIAHAAHLGGLVFGFLYAYYQWRLEPIVDRIPLFRGQTGSRPRLWAVSAPLPKPETSTDSTRLDEILQKIHKTGEVSLTDEERAILHDTSARLRNRRS